MGIYSVKKVILAGTKEPFRKMRVLSHKEHLTSTLVAALWMISPLAVYCFPPGSSGVPYVTERAFFVESKERLKSVQFT
jgi:hypothetical protein